MIISPYYRFIFIAVPKTGTTSIEQALTKLLSEKSPNQFYSNITTSRGYLSLYRNLSQIPLPSPSFLPVAYKHEALSSVKNIKPSLVHNFNTFAFVRNPWARLVSQYKQFQRPHFLHIEKRRKLHEASLDSFESFAYQYREDPRPMWQLLADDSGKLAVDHIGRFEHLGPDLSHICCQLKMPQLTLDHLNPAQGKSKNYQDYYTPQLLDIVNPVLEKDAELFGYSFD